MGKCINILDICVDINLLCSWKLNKSILKGLNGIAHAHTCVCVCVSHFKAAKLLLLDGQNKRQLHVGEYSGMMSIYTKVSG